MVIKKLCKVFMTYIAQLLIILSFSEFSHKSTNEQSISNMIIFTVGIFFYLQNFS